MSQGNSRASDDTSPLAASFHETDLDAREMLLVANLRERCPLLDQPSPNARTLFEAFA